jgi:hypothetical protein
MKNTSHTPEGRILLFFNLLTIAFLSSCVSATVTSTKVTTFEGHIKKILIDGLTHREYQAYMEGITDYLKEDFQSRDIITELYVHDSLARALNPNKLQELIAYFHPDLILEIKQLSGSFEWNHGVFEPNGNTSSAELELRIIDIKSNKIIWEAKTSASAFNTLKGMQGKKGIRKTSQKIIEALEQSGFLKSPN